MYINLSKHINSSIIVCTIIRNINISINVLQILKQYTHFNKFMSIYVLSYSFAKNTNPRYMYVNFSKNINIFPFIHRTIPKVSLQSLTLFFKHISKLLPSPPSQNLGLVLKLLFQVPYPQNIPSHKKYW